MQGFLVPFITVHLASLSLCCAPRQFSKKIISLCVVSSDFEKEFFFDTFLLLSGSPFIVIGFLFVYFLQGFLKIKVIVYEDVLYCGWFYLIVEEIFFFMSHQRLLSHSSSLHLIFVHILCVFFHIDLIVLNHLVAQGINQEVNDSVLTESLRS